MKKILLALLTIASLCSPCFASCSVTVDGVQYCDFDLTEYKGLLDAPSVSSVGGGRVYFDLAAGKLKCSEDGGAYANCVGAGGGGGSGTVTTVSVATANGFSGTVANATTTPVITLVSGALTPTSVNGVVFSGSSTPTLAVTGTSTISGSNTGDQTIALSGAVTGTGTGAITTVMNSSLDDLTNVTVPTPTTGDSLVWSGTSWVATPPTSVVGSSSSFYLDATATLADNQTLSISPSNYPEEIDTATTLIATSPAFIERFVSGPLGRASIPAGTWIFKTYAATGSNSGLNEIKFRINKRVALTGMTGTFTGAGATRTFTVTGGTPFVSGDANASRMLASLIETPTQTAWITGFTSSSVVTVNLTDPAFVNVSNVSLDAMYYYLFDTTTGDLTGTTPALYTTTTTQLEFAGLNNTDRLVIAYFGSSDNDTGTDTISLYHGGTQNFTHFITPISTLHNDLAGLNVGDYKHLTATEYTGSGTGAFARVTSPSFTTPNIGSATGSITGNAGTATALAANGANCSAGQYPLGVDASGAVESCTTAGGGAPRVVTVSDATSISPNSATTDIVNQVNTQSTGTLTVNAPSGTPADGQELMFRINSTNVQTYAWNSVYRGSLTQVLPVSSTGATAWDYYKFIFNDPDDRWDLLDKKANYTLVDAAKIILLHGNGSDGSTTATNSAGSGITFTAYSAAEIDTAQSKFGGASMHFVSGGAQDYFESGDSSLLDFAGGDWTIHAWVRFTNVDTTNVLCSRTDGGAYMYVQLQNGSGGFRLVDYSGGYVVNMSRDLTISNDTWYHIAIVRTGSVGRLFVDGVKQGADYTFGSNFVDRSSGLTVGAGTFNGAYQMQGWIDEFIVINGRAEWTADFTPPTAEE